MKTSYIQVNAGQENKLNSGDIQARKTSRIQVKFSILSQFGQSIRSGRFIMLRSYILPPPFEKS